MLNSQDDYWQLIAAPGAGAPVIDDNDYLSWTGTELISIDQVISEYQISQNGQTPPSTWQSTIPTIQAGKYLWIRNTIKLNIGDIVTYTVTYQGANGSGAVSKVNDVDPVNGNVSIQASDIPTNGILNVQDTLNSLLNSINSIIESVETTNGRYIKYASGDMICMRHISNISAPVTYNSNSGLKVAYFDSSVSGFINAAKWPQSFISKPYISITSNSSSWNIIGYVEHNATGITKIAVGRPDAGETVYLDLSCIAYGRWK